LHCVAQVGGVGCRYHRSRNRVEPAKQVADDRAAAAGRRPVVLVVTQVTWSRQRVAPAQYGYVSWGGRADASGSPSVGDVVCAGYDHLVALLHERISLVVAYLAPNPGAGSAAVRYPIVAVETILRHAGDARSAYDGTHHAYGASPAHIRAAYPVIENLGRGQRPDAAVQVRGSATGGHINALWPISGTCCRPVGLQIVLGGSCRCIRTCRGGCDHIAAARVYVDRVAPGCVGHAGERLGVQRGLDGYVSCWRSGLAVRHQSGYVAAHNRERHAAGTRSDARRGIVDYHAHRRGSRRSSGLNRAGDTVRPLVAAARHVTHGPVDPTKRGTRDLN